MIVFYVAEPLKTMEIVSKQAEAKSDDYYMQKICKRAKDSKLCNNYKLFNVLKSISNNYNVPIYIMIGIMGHESKFGTSYHKNNTIDCRVTTNNRHGSKANYTDQGVKRTTTIGPGCRLQKYDTLEEGFTSLAKTIGLGYKGCLQRSDIAKCVSRKYVGSPSISENTRVNDVNYFK